MCDICDRARRQPTQEALKTVAQAMQQRTNRGRECLDNLVGELVGERRSGQDALDRETEPLRRKVP